MLLLAGLVWLLVVVIWFPNVRMGMGAYVGSLWILICCVVAARTRTLSWGTCLRVFAFAVPWSVVIGLVSVWLSDLVFLTYEEASSGGGDADVHGAASEAVGASVAIAGLTEEALKLLPVALIVVLAARRVRRFAVVDWLLLGMASGAAFTAVEELFRRIYLTDPDLQGGILDLCAHRPPDQRIECFGIDEFGIWPIGGGSFSGEYASYAGHHVLTALVAVAVGLAIAAWRSSSSSRVPWAVRAGAVAAPVLMFWVAVVDHMGRNAVAAGGDDTWLTSQGTTIPWVVRFTFQVTGGGEGRTALLAVLFVAAVVVDARRYSRYGFPIVGAGAFGDGPAVGTTEQRGRGDGLLAWLVTQAKHDARKVVDVTLDALQDALPQLRLHARRRSERAHLGLGSRFVAAGAQVSRVLWLDAAQGVAAHSREPGESRAQAITNGRAFWSMQRQARQLVCHVDADRLAPSRFPGLGYRLMGIATLAALLAAGLAIAPIAAAGIGPELTTGNEWSWWWLAGQLDALAGWWDGLSTTQQVFIGIGAAALLAIPFGFTGGLFAAGIGTYIVDHGTGIGDLIKDPETTLQNYAANTSPGAFALDLGELLLTFMPPAIGATYGVGAKQLAKEYLDDPAAFWPRYRALMADEGGWIRFDGFLPRPKGYPDWVAYGGKPHGRLPANFRPGWAAVRQGEKGMAYQEQITGMRRLPDGGIPEYVVRNPTDGKPVSFDGRIVRGDPPHEVFLDAKDGYAELAMNPDKPWARGMRESIVDEARRQSQALPDGAVLEWKVSDPRGADAIQEILDDEGYFNISVDYIPKG
ncbi:PrsW family glutamic-type intramembrane protease [Janibacter sp. DB-40]|uniref:PrsW family glutamic-type intramembrane protease n=1 Tax=Janibacter sp. DB-40 TaxID=3028808 RepID=UPI00240539EF|nr:PrsW family glutamic-type intramembrane protease [Janibacter sp. DB-40]